MEENEVMMDEVTEETFEDEAMAEDQHNFGKIGFLAAGAAIGAVATAVGRKVAPKAREAFKSMKQKHAENQLAKAKKLEQKYTEIETVESVDEDSEEK